MLIFSVFPFLFSQISKVVSFGPKENADFYVYYFFPPLFFMFYFTPYFPTFLTKVHPHFHSPSSLSHRIPAQSERFTTSPTVCVFQQFPTLLAPTRPLL